MKIFIKIKDEKFEIHVSNSMTLAELMFQIFEEYEKQGKYPKKSQENLQYFRIENVARERSEDYREDMISLSKRAPSKLQAAATSIRLIFNNQPIDDQQFEIFQNFNLEQGRNNFLNKELDNTLEEIGIETGDTIKATKNGIKIHDLSWLALLNHVTQPSSRNYTIACKLIDKLGTGTDSLGRTASFYLERIGRWKPQLDDPIRRVYKKLHIESLPERISDQRKAEYLVRKGTEIPDLLVNNINRERLNRIRHEAVIAPLFAAVLVRYLAKIPEAVYTIIAEYLDNLEIGDQEEILLMTSQRRRAILDPLVKNTEERYSDLFLNRSSLEALSDLRKYIHHIHKYLLRSPTTSDTNLVAHWKTMTTKVLDEFLAASARLSKQPPLTFKITKKFIAKKLKAHPFKFELSPKTIAELDYKGSFSPKMQMTVLQHWLKTYWSKERGEKLHLLLLDRINSRPSAPKEYVQRQRAEEIHHFLSLYAPFMLGLSAPLKDYKSSVLPRDGFFSGSNTKISKKSTNEQLAVEAIKTELLALVKLLQKNTDTILSVSKLNSVQEIIDLYGSKELAELHDELTKMHEELNQTVLTDSDPNFIMLNKQRKDFLQKMDQGLACLATINELIEYQHDNEGKRFSNN